MAEHRTVVLTDLATGEEHRVSAKVREPEDTSSMSAADAEASAVSQSAEAALIEYRREHPGDYLVTGIERGADE